MYTHIHYKLRRDVTWRHVAFHYIESCRILHDTTSHCIASLHIFYIHDFLKYTMLWIFMHHIQELCVFYMQCRSMCVCVYVCVCVWVLRVLRFCAIFSVTWSNQGNAWLWAAAVEEAATSHWHGFWTQNPHTCFEVHDRLINFFVSSWQGGQARNHPRRSRFF